MWGATRLTGHHFGQGLISIHAPRVGSDEVSYLDAPANPISIHAPRVGSDSQRGGTPQSRSCNFNPRSPCGERPQRRIKMDIVQALISIHAPRVGSDKNWEYRINAQFKISIHAPRVGSDEFVPKFAEWFGISIHAPRVGSDCCSLNPTLLAIISIHAPRVGSDVRSDHLGVSEPISIHAPRVGSDRSQAATNIYELCISIHAPRVGSDKALSREEIDLIGFQSTLPVWGATVKNRTLETVLIISIHAPRVGSDLSIRPWPPKPGYFNPRSPCGERRPPMGSQKIT